jgi:hypothetical protein
MLFLREKNFLILVYLFEANKIEQYETSIDDQNDDISLRLNNTIKSQDIYEKRFDEMVKLFSEINY